MVQQLPLFIPDTAVRYEDVLIEEFFRFVHHCIVNERDCDFAAVKGPEVSAYCALYYEAQVNNGGHAQFIGNSGNDAHLFAAALSGLIQVDARPQEMILRRMLSWLQENPEELQKLVNTHLSSRSFRPAALDPLDSQFYDENEVSPIKSRVRTWIEQAPDLRIIPERDFLALLQDPDSWRPN